MARAGDLSTVTWNGVPTFQNPPLQIDLLAASFALFGENDLAARLPSALMALGIAAPACSGSGAAWRGEEVALTAAALLAAAPFFCNHARRCMLDVPLCFWVVVAFARRVRSGSASTPPGAARDPAGRGALDEERPRPAAAGRAGERRGLRQGNPPAAADSVALGRCARRPARRSCSWPLHQYFVHGPLALREHYVGEIASRSSAGLQPGARADGLSAGASRVLPASGAPGPRRHPVAVAQPGTRRAAAGGLGPGAHRPLQLLERAVASLSLPDASRDGAGRRALAEPLVPARRLLAETRGPGPARLRRHGVLGPSRSC